MDVAQILLLERGQLVGEKVRLLLVVAFEAEDVAGLDDAAQHVRNFPRGHELAAGQLADPRDAFGLVLAALRCFCSYHGVYFVYPS